MTATATASTVRVDVNDDLDAIQLQQLITRLGTLRSQMQPAFSQSAPTPDELKRQPSLFNMTDDPTVNIGLLTDGYFRLWLRHIGFGWLAFDLRPSTAANIAHFVSNRIAAEDRTTVNLLTSETGDGGSAH